MLASLGGGGPALELQQTEVDLKAAVPLLGGDEANFVTGLALDYSSAVRARRLRAQRRAAAAARARMAAAAPSRTRAPGSWSRVRGGGEGGRLPHRRAAPAAQGCGRQ